MPAQSPCAQPCYQSSLNDEPLVQDWEAGILEDHPKPGMRTTEANSLAEEQEAGTEEPDKAEQLAAADFAGPES